MEAVPQNIETIGPKSNSLEKGTSGCETWQSHPSLFEVVDLSRLECKDSLKAFGHVFLEWFGKKGTKDFGQKPGSV